MKNSETISAILDQSPFDTFKCDVLIIYLIYLDQVVSNLCTFRSDCRVNWKKYGHRLLRGWEDIVRMTSGEYNRIWLCGTQAPHGSQFFFLILLNRYHFFSMTRKLGNWPQFFDNMSKAMKLPAASCNRIIRTKLLLPF